MTPGHDTEAPAGADATDTASVDPDPDPATPAWSWYFVRGSGLFLAVLLPLHFAIVIIRDDIGRTSFGTVTSRFADARWQALELVTLLLALMHGFLALRRVVLSSASLSPAARDRVVVAMGAVGVLLAIALVWSMLSLA